MIDVSKESSCEEHIHFHLLHEPNQNTRSMFGFGYLKKALSQWNNKIHVMSYVPVGALNTRVE